ncbi:MAG: iron-sulfur cluster assembly accessory protein [Chloroflexi bacterium]|nr:iron-sulfur cluster assembly accessory protein [Chloroflexota bacterium]
MAVPSPLTALTGPSTIVLYAEKPLTGGSIVTTATPLNTINITENAARHVREFTGKLASEAITLRVGVKGGGCSGLTYDLSIDSEARPTDKVIEQHGVTIFIDKKSYIFLAGTTLDYSGGLNGKGFQFHNPNAKTTCGCGTSFSV